MLFPMVRCLLCFLQLFEIRRLPVSDSLWLADASVRILFESAMKSSDRIVTTSRRTQSQFLMFLTSACAMQAAANFQFMPLPGAMFGDSNDKNFRPTPRWASIEPEQVTTWPTSLPVSYPSVISAGLLMSCHAQGVLEPGAGTEIMLSLYVDGGPAGSADFLTSSQVDKSKSKRRQWGAGKRDRPAEAERPMLYAKGIKE